MPPKSVTGKSCQICLEEEAPGAAITFVREVDFVNLPSLIRDVTGVKLTKTNGRYGNVCDSCIGKAELAQAFKQKACESSVRIQSISTPPPDDDSIEDSESHHSLKTKIRRPKYFHYARKKFPQPYSRNSQSLSESSNHLNQELAGWKLIRDLLAESAFQKACCPLCFMTFDFDTQLAQHLWAAHPEFMGKDVNARPKKLDASEVHRRLTHYGYILNSVDNNNIKCTLCHEPQASTFLYLLHWNKHMGKEVYGCFNCKNVYLKSGSYTCCPRNTTAFTVEDNNTQCVMNEITLYKILNNRRVRLHSCSLCSAIFAATDKLLAHHESHHADVSYCCNLCYKEFPSLEVATRHKNFCKASFREMKCPLCDQTFAFEEPFNLHIAKNHTQKEVQRNKIRKLCLVCNKSFMSQDQLDAHSIIHAENYECYICKCKLSNAEKLREHMKGHRPTTVTPHNVCTYCGREYPYKTHLVAHIRQHSEKKCEVCSKVFTNTNLYDNHMYVHEWFSQCIDPTDVGEYVCEVCEETFTEATDLNEHQFIASCLETDMVVNATASSSFGSGSQESGDTLSGDYYADLSDN